MAEAGWQELGKSNAGKELLGGTTIGDFYRYLRIESVGRGFAE
jgi:hypothetical protein